MSNINIWAVGYVIPYDLHIHSIQSACGMHTVLELLEIASKKDMCGINICDHGKLAGQIMNFGVIANPLRTPKRVEFIDKDGDERGVDLFAGIEANICEDGSSDMPDWTKASHQFDLISAGFHNESSGSLKTMKDEYLNFGALSEFVKKYPLDILTHPCIASYPLPIGDLLMLAAKHGFALEVNNTNLLVEKTDLEKLRLMVEGAIEDGVRLVCNSDGHTWHEMGRYNLVYDLFKKFGFASNNQEFENIFPLNFDTTGKSLRKFISERKEKRGC